MTLCYIKNIKDFPEFITYLYSQGITWVNCQSYEQAIERHHAFPDETIYIKLTEETEKTRLTEGFTEGYTEGYTDNKKIYFWFITNIENYTDKKYPVYTAEQIMKNLRKILVQIKLSA